MKRAVIVGKFHPLHNGHSFLIQTALNECDEVHVLVCDHKDFTLSAELRASWIAQIHAEAYVKIIEDIEKDDDSEAWATHTINFLGFTPDVAYTSEDYGDTWAAAMGCEHRKVDVGRKTVPISATKIRNDIRKNWDHMHPSVRSYFATRIVVVGAESTGTTTLASELAKHYKSPWTVELGRYYSLSLLHSGHKWDDRDFFTIARMQQDYEDSMAELSNGLLICDTNAFATKLWQERYMGNVTEDVTKLAECAPADLYILTGDEIPFVQDGLRDGEHIRHHMHMRFESELQKLGTPFILVRGTLENRLSQSIHEIDRIEHKTIDLYKEKNHDS